MANEVGAERCHDTGAPAVAGQNLPEADPRKLPTALVQKQERNRRLPGQINPSAGHVSLKASQSRPSYRYQALFVALTEASHHAEVTVEVLPPHAYQLRYAHAGGVKHFEHRAVSQSGRGGRIWLGEE